MGIITKRDPSGRDLTFCNYYGCLILIIKRDVCLMWLYYAIMIINIISITMET